MIILILSFTVIKAANLTAKDPNGKSDPYCQVYMGSGENIVHKTEIKQCTLDPEWNETFTLYEGELAPFLYSAGKQGSKSKLNVWPFSSLAVLYLICLIQLSLLPTLSNELFHSFLSRF